MIQGFAAMIGSEPITLILGSLPSQDSLKQTQYYGHKRNAFWPIMAHLLHFSPEQPYEERLATLKANRIALWDVIKSAERSGSLDSAIRRESIEPNDFTTLLTHHPSIEHICFNGSSAFQLFRTHVWPTLSDTPIPKNSKPTTITARFFDQKTRTLTPLPSTSPAYAALSLQEKQRRWQQALAP